MHRRFWVKNSVAVRRFAAPARLSILVRIARHHLQVRELTVMSDELATSAHKPPQTFSLSNELSQLATTS
jgi:hypothetical protein